MIIFASIPNGYDNSWQVGASTHLLLAEPIIKVLRIRNYDIGVYIGAKRANSIVMSIMAPCYWLICSELNCKLLFSGSVIDRVNLAYRNLGNLDKLSDSPLAESAARAVPRPA